MQSLTHFVSSNIDFTSYTSYISSFSLNKFVLAIDLFGASTAQFLEFFGYTTAKKPSSILTNRYVFDLIMANEDVCFFSEARSIKPMTTEVAVAFEMYKLSATNSFSYSYEVVAYLASKTTGYVGVVLSVFFFISLFFFLFMVVFTLFIPLSLHLYSSDLFLLGVDSSYGLVESEKEVGALDDILLPLFLVLAVSVGWFFLLLPYQVLNTLNSFTDSLILLFFCCIIVSLPINLLYECGFFFSTFFRGSAGSTSTLMELVYDLIANTTMFARMQVQHVRVLLGLAMYIETATFVETLSLNQLLDTPQAFNYHIWNKPTEHFTNSGLSFVMDLVMQFATLIGELSHYILFLLQSSASYAALIFWLFSLLYSGFFKDLIEVYFVWKNSQKK